MAKTWYPIIDEEKCLRCGTCVDFCPHDVYEQDGDGRPLVVAPERWVPFIERQCFVRGDGNEAGAF